MSNEFKMVHSWRGYLNVMQKHMWWMLGLDGGSGWRIRQQKGEVDF